MAVIADDLNGGAATVPEDEQSAGEGVGLQMLFAYPGQTINPVAEIDGLDRHQDARLG